MIMPPCAMSEPVKNRLSSSEGAREMPGYRLMSWKIKIKMGRYGQYMTNDLKLMAYISYRFTRKNPAPKEIMIPRRSERINAELESAVLVLWYLLRYHTSKSESVIPMYIIPYFSKKVLFFSIEK
jgi:hypothetical protein